MREFLLFVPIITLYPLSQPGEADIFTEQYKIVAHSAPTGGLPCRNDSREKSPSSPGRQRGSGPPLQFIWPPRAQPSSSITPPVRRGRIASSARSPAAAA